MNRDQGRPTTAMTPISAIASLPLASPDSDPGAGRVNRRAVPPPDVTPSDSESPAANDKTTAERSFWDRLWGKEGFSFGAMLDIINPLQHIPIVATIYRAATGDTIGAGPRMVGGALFGGVVGLIAAAADAAVEGITGKDTGSHVLAMLPEPDPGPQIALDDLPRSRTLRTAYLNQLNGLTPQTAAQQSADKTAAEAIGETAGKSERPAEAPLEVSQARAASPLEPDTNQNTNRLFRAPPRSAQLGAGGQLVPLATHGRPGGNLPTAKELAANPALLQEMRQGGASAINASQPPAGRIDTAIKGRGLVTPSPVSQSSRNNPAGAAAWYDRMARESQAKNPGGNPKPSDTTSGSPEVGPDFLMKMQQALDKYQALRPAPSVDVAH